MVRGVFDVEVGIVRSAIGAYEERQGESRAGRGIEFLGNNVVPVAENEVVGGCLINGVRPAVGGRSGVGIVGEEGDGAAGAALVNWSSEASCRV